MNRLRRIFPVFIPMIMFFPAALNAQPTADSAITEEMTFEWKKDTLYSSTGLKFYQGKKLVVGNPAGDDGYYRSIIARNAAIVPSIWGQDRRYDHAIENHVNVKKSRELVLKSMIPGDSLTIKGIGLWKESKPNFYLVRIATASESFLCDIKFALLLEELLLL